MIEIYNVSVEENEPTLPHLVMPYIRGESLSSLLRQSRRQKQPIPPPCIVHIANGLCDALDYASELEPDLTVDLATLTGACVVALGNDIAGCFTRERGLDKKIIDSGRAAGEETVT